MSRSNKATGFVFLVGAGPGDPDLITMKGIRCLGSADVVLHDRLIHPRLLGKARRGTTIINVGKRADFEDEQQDAINHLMIEYAQQGKTVCRLKGGDPFIFGRGGEEIEALALAGISFEVVPGVSSIVAAPGAAGIPVTDRRHGHAFMAITGAQSLDFDSAEWTAARTLLSAGGSVVVVMGLARVPLIAAYLLDQGCAKDLPVALIARATWPDEDIVFGELGGISKGLPPLQTPAVFIMGSVVSIGRNLESLAWQQQAEEHELF